MRSSSSGRDRTNSARSSRAWALKALGRRQRRDALSTEHSGVDEDIGEKRFADGDCHVLQASCLTKTSVLRRRSV